MTTIILLAVKIIKRCNINTFNGEDECPALCWRNLSTIFFYHHKYCCLLSNICVRLFFAYLRPVAYCRRL
jgi:hypothetical protein